MKDPEIMAAEEVSDQQKVIFFECPFCAKRLAIEPDGAGLVIECPSCEQEFEIPSPGPEALAQISSAGEAVRKDHQLRQRCLEQARTLDKIASEMTVIQGALDRVIAAIAEVKNLQR